MTTTSIDRACPAPDAGTESEIRAAARRRGLTMKELVSMATTTERPKIEFFPAPSVKSISLFTESVQRTTDLVFRYMKRSEIKSQYHLAQLLGLSPYSGVCWRWFNSVAWESDMSITYKNAEVVPFPSKQ